MLREQQTFFEAAFLQGARPFCLSTEKNRLEVFPVLFDQIASENKWTFLI